MPCTFKPMQAYGASRSSLLQRLGIGDVWAFLRDLVQNVMLRADFYDGEGNFYHGLANAIGGEGSLQYYAGDTPSGSPETVNDYWQVNPQTEEFVMAPGVTAMVRSSNRYKITTPGSAWVENGTHKELMYKVLINGETHYGRIPLFTNKEDEACYVPQTGETIATSYTTFGQVGTAVAALRSMTVNLNNKLAAQGVLRMIWGDYSGNGGPD